MDWAPAALEALPLWRDLEPSVESAPVNAEIKGPPPFLGDLFAIRPFQHGAGAEAKSEGLVVYALVNQDTEPAQSVTCSQVTMQAVLVQEPKGEEPGRTFSSTVLARIKIEILGYDVQRSGPFRRFLLNSAGHGVILLGPKCCAVAALPQWSEDFGSGPIEETVRAVPLVPARDVSVIKAAWHPLSDAHMGVLLSDNSWQLLNLRRRAQLLDSEVRFSVDFGHLREEESCVDFCFGEPWAAGHTQLGASEAVWLSVVVLFLSSSGRIACRSPVLPSLSVFPQRALEELPTSTSAEAQEWLERTLLCASNRNEIDLPGVSDKAYLSVQHDLHLHGESSEFWNRWVPVEQIIEEECNTRDGENDATPKRSNYCSVHLVAHAPVAVIARATTAGMVDIVTVDGALGPSFGNGNSQPCRDLHCCVFEDLDLAVPLTRAPTTELSALTVPNGNGVFFPCEVASTGCSH